MGLLKYVCHKYSAFLEGVLLEMLEGDRPFRKEFYARLYWSFGRILHLFAFSIIANIIVNLLPDF